MDALVRYPELTAPVENIYRDEIERKLNAEKSKLRWALTLVLSVNLAVISGALTLMTLLLQE